MGGPAEKLEAVAATPPALVHAELDKLRERQSLPAVVGELRRDWRAAIEPVWQRVRAACAADLALRKEQFATGGLARVLEQLHPTVASPTTCFASTSPTTATTASTWPGPASPPGSRTDDIGIYRLPWASHTLPSVGPNNRADADQETGPYSQEVQATPRSCSRSSDAIGRELSW